MVHLKMDTKQELIRKITARAKAEVASWPQWKKDESDREDARFREMGEVARSGRGGQQ